MGVGVWMEDNTVQYWMDSNTNSNSNTILDGWMDTVSFSCTHGVTCIHRKIASVA